jgi:hypothetical protein
MPKNKRNRHRAKRQWRGIDTADIEDESLRKQQELLAGGPLNKRKTEDLAYVDKGGKSSSLFTQFQFVSFEIGPTQIFLPVRVSVFLPCAL